MHTLREKKGENKKNEEEKKRLQNLLNHMRLRTYSQLLVYQL